jgi:hypothetical protein
VDKPGICFLKKKKITVSKCHIERGWIWPKYVICTYTRT